MSVEGPRIRRIHDPPLRRSEQPMFIFGWTLLHVIDEASPLYGATPESFAASRAYLLLTIGGTDDTPGQTLMSRQEYFFPSIYWNHAFGGYPGLPPRLAIVSLMRKSTTACNASRPLAPAARASS
jgi:inward rectifier potassium channel